MSIEIPPPPTTGGQPVGPQGGGQPTPRVSLLQILIISIFLLAFVVMIGMLIPPRDASHRVEEAKKDFAATVAFDAATKVSAGAGEQAAGEKAIKDFSPRDRGSGGGPPDPPDGRKRIWEFEPPCKLKVNAEWDLPLLKGAIKAPEINACTTAFYACAGAMILTCRADQSWGCFNDAFDKKCASWRETKEE
jgi:hypothetical protein